MKKGLLFKVLTLILVVGLSVSAGVAGTLAYLQSEDSDVNVMTLGNVKIEQHEYQRKVNEDGTFKTDTIDGVTSYVLEEFEDNKPLLPSAIDTETWVGWDYDSTMVRMTQVDSYGGMQVFFEASNAQDKFVTVENTGKTDAYIRTFVAIEVGEADPALIGTSYHFTWKSSEIGLIEIDGNKYFVNEYVYKGGQLSDGTWRHENGILPAGDTSYPNLSQVYIHSKAENTDMDAIDGNKNGKLDILVLSQAIQAEGFETAEKAFAAGFPMGDSNINLASWFGGVIAEHSADVWDGTSDTTWYNDTDTEFIIETAEELAGFGELVDGGNTFEGKTVKLGADLDLKHVADGADSPTSFDPIGYGYDIVFRGTFDGQNHTISNLYQNGWSLGYDYSTEGGGLFASVVDATIKNLNIDQAEVVMECVDMGIVVGYSYGDCTYENITVTDSTIANYQRYTGGVVGEVNGKQTFKNVDVKDTVISSLWGDFDCSLGGIIGGKYGEAEIIMEDCDVAAELNAYNDVTSSYQWYAYRRAGMLIGNTEETETIDGRTVATASYLTAKNCTVTYEDWANYTYCEFAGTSWPYVRVQAGYSSDAYSNPRYGVATDANGNKAVDDSHVHNEGEDHNILLAFDQLFGGGQGVYGTSTYDGVTVVYPN